MTNEEKATEIVETVRKSVVQRYQNEHYKNNYFDEVKDCCMEMAEWKDEQFENEKQKLIDKACNEFSNFLEEMKEIWWKGDGCDESVKSHWLTSFRKAMKNMK